MISVREAGKAGAIWTIVVVSVNMQLIENG